MKNKKGVSPVIATVLLIAMVVVIALILFLWFRGMAVESITKFGGKNVELVCDEVTFDASYSDNTLYITNTGNVPIFGMKIKMVSPGSHQTKDIRDISENWPTVGMNQGASFAGSASELNSYEELILIPVLIGNSDQGEKTFTCDENRFGYPIQLTE